MKGHAIAVLMVWSADWLCLKALASSGFEPSSLESASVAPSAGPSITDRDNSPAGHRDETADAPGNTVGVFDAFTIDSAPESSSFAAHRTTSLDPTNLLILGAESGTIYDSSLIPQRASPASAEYSLGVPKLSYSTTEDASDLTTSSSPTLVNWTLTPSNSYPTTRTSSTVSVGELRRIPTLASILTSTGITSSPSPADVANRPRGALGAPQVSAASPEVSASFSVSPGSSSSSRIGPAATQSSTLMGVSKDSSWIVTQPTTTVDFDVDSSGIIYQSGTLVNLATASPSKDSLPSTTVDLATLSPTTAVDVTTESLGTAPPRGLLTPPQGPHYDMRLESTEKSSEVPTLSVAIKDPILTVSQAGCQDLYLGDCAADFSSRCDEPLVRDLCSSTCNLC